LSFLKWRLTNYNIFTFSGTFVFKNIIEDSVEHVLALFEQHKQHKHANSNNNSNNNNSNNNSSSSNNGGRRSKGNTIPKCCRTSGAIRSMLCQPINVVMPVVVPSLATTTTTTGAATATSKASRAIKIGFDLQAGSYATCCLRSMTGRNDLLL